MIDCDNVQIRDGFGVPIVTNKNYKGDEGSVWYCHLDHYTRLYKLKPPTIEKIHMFGSAKGSKMGKIAIRNTY